MAELSLNLLLEFRGALFKQGWSHRHLFCRVSIDRLERRLKLPRLVLDWRDRGFKREADLVMLLLGNNVRQNTLREVCADHVR